MPLPDALLIDWWPSLLKLAVASSKGDADAAQRLVSEVLACQRAIENEQHEAELIEAEEEGYYAALNEVLHRTS